MHPLSKAITVAGLRNLGPKSAALLASVGLRTRDDLARVGAIGACRMLLLARRKISVNMAYAIEGALTDCDWRQIPAPFRKELVLELRRLRAEVKSA